MDSQDGLHYHLWVRSGRVFTMRMKRHATRIAAAKTGEREGLPADRRMVRQCTECPTKSKSKQPGLKRARWAAFAESLGVSTRTIRHAAMDANLPGAWNL